MFLGNTIVILKFNKFSGCSPIGGCVGGTLANVQWTFASWPKYKGYIGESSMEIRQLANVQGLHWRKFSGRSPMAKVHFAKFLLAKFR
jgi:hypothetical protein